MIFFKKSSLDKPAKKPKTQMAIHERTLTAEGWKRRAVKKAVAKKK